MSDSIRVLVAQYFQLVDPQNLSIPPGSILVQPQVQAALYERMFEETLTPLPPATYRTRVLKLILARIEESLTDPEEDVCQLTSYSFPQASKLADAIVYYLITSESNLTSTLLHHRKLLTISWTPGALYLPSPSPKL